MKTKKKKKITFQERHPVFQTVLREEFRDAIRLNKKLLYPQMKEVLDTNKIKIEVKKMGNKLEGMTFCFTGKLETMKRAEAEQLVKDNGGQARAGVSKNLTYLVTNSTESTAKYTKAQEQNTKIITEDEFLKMIE